MYAGTWGQRYGGEGNLGVFRDVTSQMNAPAAVIEAMEKGGGGVEHRNLLQKRDASFNCCEWGVNEQYINLCKMASAFCKQLHSFAGANSPGQELTECPIVSVA